MVGPEGETDQKIKSSVLMYLILLSKFRIYKDFRDVVAHPNVYRTSIRWMFTASRTRLYQELEEDQ